MAGSELVPHLQAADDLLLEDMVFPCRAFVVQLLHRRAERVIPRIRDRLLECAHPGLAIEMHRRRQIPGFPSIVCLQDGHDHLASQISPEHHHIRLVKVGSGKNLPEADVRSVNVRGEKDRQVEPGAGPQFEHVAPLRSGARPHSTGISLNAYAMSTPRLARTYFTARKATRPAANRPSCTPTLRFVCPAATVSIHRRWIT